MRVEFTPAGNPVKHGGSGTGYRSYGCRCLECTEANRARAVQNQKIREAGPIPATVLHGKATTYINWGCRCEPCTEAQTRKCKSYYARNLSSQARYDAEMAAYYSGTQKGPKPVLKTRDNRDAETVIMAFVSENGRLPRKRAKDLDEQRLFYRLHSARTSNKDWANTLFEKYRTR